MTDEQINAAIAEACGWRKEDGVYMWTANGIDYTCPDLWDWANDLNAMHEAEKVLTQKQRDEYRHWLCPDIFSTARERAEVFLKTLGKWEEEA